MKKPSKCQDMIVCVILTTAHHVVYVYAYTYVFHPQPLDSSVHVILTNSLLTLEN